MGGKNSGRRLRLTQEVQDTILKHLKAGAFRCHAAEAAGISDQAMEVWMRRGGAGEAPYAAFYEAVRKVQAEDAVRSQSVITAAQFRRVDGDWKAAAYNLERKFPKQYGPQATPQFGVTIAPGGDDSGGTRTKVEFYLPDNGRRPTALTDDGEEEA